MKTLSEAKVQRIDQRVLRDVLKSARALKKENATDREILLAIGKLALIGAIGTITSPELRQHAYTAVQSVD
jgi:hypothetical protein